MRRLLFLLVSTGVAYAATAQLNSRIGYTLGLYDTPAYDALVERYNTDFPFLDGLDGRNVVNGLTVGLRYRLGPTSVEGSWRNQFTSSRSLGDLPAGGEFERRVKTRFNTYSAGLAAHLGSFALGGSIDYSTFNVRTRLTGNDNPLDLLDGERSWGHTLFVSWEPGLSGEVLSLAIRPYWQAVWSELDFAPLGAELEPDRFADMPPSTYRDDFGHFGVLFIFYNGRHD